MKKLIKRPVLWLVVYAFMALIVFERGLKRIDVEKQRLLVEQQTLAKRKDIALKSRFELEQIIASQNDPEWIEQTLMKILGLVPEGYKKVIFMDD